MSKNLNHERMKSICFIVAMVFLLVGVWRCEKNCYADDRNGASDRVNSYLSNYVERIDINNWLTYRNDQYGFELKYPPDFGKEELLSKDNLLNLTKKEKDHLIIEVRLQPKHLLEDYYRGKNWEKIEIEGRQGYQYFFVEGIGDTGVVLIPLEGETLQITCDVIGDSRPSDKVNFVKRIIQKIVSTIRFEQP